MAATYGHWELRGQYAQVLSDVAVKQPAWLDGWLRACPDDPHAWLLQAYAEGARAGEARGGGKASETSQAQFRSFAELMKASAEACERAADLAPDDPTPWIQSIWSLFGRGGDAGMFQRRFAELTARDPHNHLGHEAAMQFLTEKWYGSHPQMYELVMKAAAGAPDGSPLAILPVQAHIEYALREFCWDRREGVAENVEFWRSRGVRQSIADARRRWEAAGPPSHPLAVKCRSVLAFAYSWGEMFPAAAELFDQLGDRASRYPWYYRGANEEKVYLRCRREALSRRHEPAH